MSVKKTWLSLELQRKAGSDIGYRLIPCRTNNLPNLHNEPYIGSMPTHLYSLPLVSSLFIPLQMVKTI